MDSANVVMELFVFYIKRWLNLCMCPRLSSSQSSLGTSSHQLGAVECQVPHTETSDASHALIKVLEFLTSQQELNDALREVEPFPETEPFQAVRLAYERACRGIGFEERLSMYLKRVDTMTQAMQERYVLHLRRLLDDSRENIRNLACNGETPRNLIRNAWKLVSTASDVKVNGLITLCGELLSLLGPFGPYTITLRATHVSPIRKWTKPIAHILEARLTTDATALDLAMPHIFYHIYEALLNSNVAVVQCAQVTLYEIVTSDYGRTALDSDKLGQVLKQYFKVYKNTVPLKTGRAPEAQIAGSAPYAVNDEEIWALAAVSYDKWVCKLAAALLGYAGNPQLRLLQRIASLRPSLAELLLPFVLQDLAFGKVDQSHIKQALSDKIHAFVLLEVENAPKASHLILACLEFLRHCYCDWAICMKGAKHYTPKVHEPPSKWSKVYWLDLDYQVTSTAAFKCSAFFTALVYIEHWCEETTGSLSLPESTMNDLDQCSLPSLDALLIDISR